MGRTLRYYPSSGFLPSVVSTALFCETPPPSDKKLLLIACFAKLTLCAPDLLKYRDLFFKHKINLTVNSFTSEIFHTLLPNIYMLSIYC